MRSVINVHVVEVVVRLNLVTKAVVLLLLTPCLLLLPLFAGDFCLDAELSALSSFCKYLSLSEEGRAGCATLIVFLLCGCYYTVISCLFVV